MKSTIALSLLFAFAGLVFNQATAQNNVLTSYVDFGAPRSEYPFNSFLDFEVGAQQDLGMLVSCASLNELIIVDDFAGVHNSGATNPSPDVVFPSTATSDGFFGHTQLINGVSNPTGALEIRNLVYESGLSLYDTATIGLFASSSGLGNRQTCFTIFGRDTIHACIDAANNNTEVLEVRIRPAFRSARYGDGYIKIEVTAGPDNDTPEGFFYLNALSISDNKGWILGDVHGFPRRWDTIPKIFEIGETVPIDFIAFNPCVTELGLLIDGEIVDTVSDVHHFWERKWPVPNFPSNSARLIAFDSARTRYYGSASSPFQIIAPSDSCTIVVLGSSTAEGEGPRAIDSTWVNRFRNSYKQYDTRVEVVNMGQADQSTFQLLPTGSTIPSGINETIDEDYNISAALAYNPEAIIINIQAADAIRGYDAAQQLANYEEIIQAAGNVPVYITSPHPGEYSTSVLDIQLEMLDSTLARYGDHAIDFWTPVADVDGKIDSIYGAVDKLHLSNAGHRLLWENVIAKQLDTLLTCQRISSISTPSSTLPLSLKLAPNPTRSETTLSFTLEESGNVYMEVFNLMGQRAKTLSTVYFGRGDQQVPISTDGLPAGIYVIHVAVQSQGLKKRIGSVRMLVQ